MIKESEKRESEIVDLYIHVNCITYIDCDECKRQDQYEGDLFDCMDVIYDDGWRSIDKKCLCKNCIKELK